MTEPAPRPKPPKHGAVKLTPEEQRRRFIEAVLEAEAREDEFDANLKIVAKARQRA